MVWRTWNLGRFRGVSVLVDASALILVAYLGLRSLDQYNQYFAGGQLFLLIAVIVVGYLLSILLHEVGHVLMGRVFGIRSRAIILHGFGGAAFLDEVPDTPLKQAAIAAAGPFTNIALWWILTPIAEDRIATASGVSTFWVGMAIVASANQWFGIFNLVPAPPLDGGSIMEALLWSTTKDRSEAFRLAGTVGLGALGVVLLLAFQRVYPFEVGVVIFLGIICGPVCWARRSGAVGGGLAGGIRMSAPSRSAPTPKRPAPETAELEQLRIRAISQAREFGHAEVTSAHVLLALANARYSPVGLTLSTFGTSYSDLWDIARQQASMVTNLQPPQESKEVKRIVERAAKSGVGAAGAFLAFEPGSPAGKLLLECGVDLRQAQEELRASLS